MSTSGRKARIRDRIWKENNNICAHCGHKIYSSYNKTLDHFIPKSCFGSLDQRNMFPLCRKCNKEKGNKLLSLDYYIFCSEEKKFLAAQYGVDYNSRISTLG